MGWVPVLQKITKEVKLRLASDSINLGIFDFQHQGWDERAEEDSHGRLFRTEIAKFLQSGEVKSSFLGSVFCGDGTPLFFVACDHGSTLGRLLFFQ